MDNFAAKKEINMPTATATRPSEQQQAQGYTHSPAPTQVTVNNHYMEQSMNHPAVNFLMPSSEQNAKEHVIVQSKEGVNIEQSLRNVRDMASTWYKSSTRQLYLVLGQCYELYYLIETADSNKRDKYRDDVKSAFTALDGVQGANSLLGRIISVVFNFADLDRRQRSRYGSVIKAAFSTEPKPVNAEAFVSWLERTGGIVAALDKRDSKKGDKMEQSAINEVVRAMPAKAQLSIPNKGNKFVVLLAQPVDSNTVKVLYQFEDDTIGDSLATKAYKAQQKLAKEAEKADTAASEADKLAAEINAQEEA